MSPAAATPFDPTHILRPGLSLVEASAGTGKTFNIAHLVLRLVAERAIPIKRILVVTFTRAATAELKERIRKWLADALVALVAPDARAIPGVDPLLVTFREQADDVRHHAGDDWTRRVRDALEAFDEAFVSTIHGFCQRMLAQNAFESDADFGLELVQDPGPLLAEIVDDVLTRSLYAVDAAEYAFLVDRCGFTREGLLALAKRAVDDPDVRVLPAPSAVDLRDQGPALARALLAAHPDFVATVAAAVEAAKQAGVFTKGQRTYNAQKAAAPAAALYAWLSDSEDPTRVDPPEAAVSYFYDLKAMASKLANPAAPFTHPALEAVRPLLALPDQAAAARRADFVVHVRRAFERNNATRRVQTYQDLLRGLARRLQAPPGDPRREALVAAVGARFDAALIDEFQDTDALQWTTFRTLFGETDQHLLYLIGDPKQAIYGFRGANVHVYLDAKRAALHPTTMTRNWRSDAGLVAAHNHLMDRAGFFAIDGIPYEVVDTPPRTPATRLRPAPGAPAAAGAPLQLRFFDRHLAPGAAPDGDPDLTTMKALTKGEAGRLLPGRVAADLVELLDSGARLHAPRDRQADADGFRPVRPGDCAVLVRTGAQGAAIARALRAVGVPAVTGGGDSVLASEEARHLLLWLEAVAAGGRDAPARAAALTPLFGETLETLRAVDDERPDAIAAWERWLGELAQSLRQLEAHGFMATFRAMTARRGVAERLLSWPDGERRLTNLRHLVELVHAAESAERLGVSGLVAWLRRQRDATSLDRETLELRLERDDEAVKVVTMHAAKGLEYPIVFAPYLWDGRLLRGDDADMLIVPDDDDPTGRLLDLHKDAKAPPKDAHLRRAEREAQRENLRLLYVALTRAKQRLYVYVGHVKSLETSPLAAALYGDPIAGSGPGTAADPADPGDPSVARLVTAEAFVLTANAADLKAPLDALAATAPRLGDATPALAVTLCLPPARRRYRAPAEGAATDAAALAARVFTRAALERLWRRHSYTALTRDLHAGPAGPAGPKSHAPPAPAPAPPPPVDPAREAFDADDVAATPAALFRARDPMPPLDPAAASSPAVPFADFPGGTEAGTFLHAVFEHLDFTLLAPAADPTTGHDALSALLDERLELHGFDPTRWRDPLIVAFTAAVQAPLGGPLGTLALCDLPRADRLDELGFDLPLAGGMEHGSAEHAVPVDGRDLVRALCLRPGDAQMSQSYLDRLRGLSFGQLAGFLTGSIDLAFRHGGRWYVADYKSNRIDPERSGPLTVHHFAPARLRWEMEEHHYYLQYHLYTLALHRYLRWRIGAGYDYETHMGGVYYLFIRGMTGASAAAPLTSAPGVFHDRPPFVVIDTLDRLFADPAATAKTLGGAR